MRIRVSVLAPLPPLKAWFLIPAPTTECFTIIDLKSYLIRQLPFSLDCVSKPEDLRLEVDEFELLDGSKFEILNGEKDILWSVPSRLYTLGCVSDSDRYREMINETYTPVMPLFTQCQAISNSYSDIVQEAQEPIATSRGSVVSTLT